MRDLASVSYQLSLTTVLERISSAAWLQVPRTYPGNSPPYCAFLRAALAESAQSLFVLLFLGPIALLYVDPGWSFAAEIAPRFKQLHGWRDYIVVRICTLVFRPHIG